ncbi:MAG: bifunctional diaminohydroxyphosphoribosylaminopyrimidine deaminase/5-amino-6-(5-phosphoribosylamino)uracil reductase RibD, partial [Bdellovibrionota bacterium]
AEAMRLAILEGAKGAGFVSPNPLVGCTIVDPDHRFLAVGYHRRHGSDHAEVDALKKLSTIEGCHLYVTLEPCAHQGRTPSCAKTLAPLKPASVTYAVEDPNPLVAGKGAAILREAGIKTQAFADRNDVPGVDKVEIVEAAEELAEIFLHVHRKKAPFVAVKVATSLDGQMAMVSGESKWITGEIAREHVHVVRAQYDAVAVGHATFFSDDPSLNVRHPSFPGHTNRAVLFDFGGTAFESLSKSKLLSVRPPENVIVVTGPDVARGSSGIRHIQVPIDDEGKFEMKTLLESLGNEGLNSLLVEGGAYTFGSFFQARAVQRVHVYVAPVVIGGRHAISWSRHFGGSALAEKLTLKNVRRQEFGPDLYWTGRPDYE